MNKYLLCPEGCDDELLLPAIPVEQDCTDYDQSESQVSDLFIIPVGAPDIFASWATTPTYVAASVDNTVTDNSKAKWLVGIGGIAVPEKNTIAYPKKKSKTDRRNYPLVFRVLNLENGMYEFLRKVQCGSTSFTFYYGDLAKYAYGKAGGLVPAFVDVDFPKGEGNDDKNQAIITLRFEANVDPERRVNPYIGV